MSGIAVEAQLKQLIPELLGMLKFDLLLDLYIQDSY